jgi:hypothetical protein
LTDALLRELLDALGGVPLLLNLNSEIRKGWMSQDIGAKTLVKNRLIPATVSDDFSHEFAAQ